MALGTCAVLLIAAVRADLDAPSEPARHVFLVRNPFGLKPQPTNTVAAGPTNPPVKVDLKLAGITSDSAGKRAWIVIPPSPARPGVAAVTNSTHFAIAEGGRQGEIEVLEINPKENTVKILNAGVAVTLDFASYGLAAPAALPGRLGGVPGAPRVMPMPGAPPSAIPSRAMPGAWPGVKTAAVNPGAFAPNPGGVGTAAALSPSVAATPMESSTALRTIPARSVRTAVEAPADIDPARQVILMRAQEAQMRAAGRPFPPLPPIPGAPPSE
jgi:hypothetical protein